MQAWWAAGSMIPAQASIGSAWAGGMQRGSSAMAAAADAPSIALFIRSIRVMHTRRYRESSGQKGRVDAMNGNRTALMGVDQRVFDRQMFGLGEADQPSRRPVSTVSPRRDR